MVIVKLFGAFFAKAIVNYSVIAEVEKIKKQG